ncbi:GPI-anchored wall transfer protein 1 [Rhizophagus irregularis]|uniref:GPI-anchored wall transfer protein n=1 Tax=Rhizophagus irregularis TaxID=588596 RepID=A0A2N1NQM0_9GLOM|nr:GPI-anchored wall transfer protein 1 [Rhizophagus irregularis]
MDDFDEIAYKKEKEDWVTGHSGGSTWEINSVCGVLLSSYIIWSALSKYTKSFNYTTNNTGTLILEFIIIVLPSVLACTILSSYTFYINALFLSLSIFVNYKFAPKPSIEEQEKLKKRSKWEKGSDDEEEKDGLEGLIIKEGLDDDENSKIKIERSQIKPFLSIYRASMMILTCISILAVDFFVFPRRFAKVETFGTSLMDLGVGSFVFSSGIVAARPFLKKPENRFKSLKGQLFKAVKQAFPLLLLGFIRLIMVKGVDYQEHVTEYGVHWNFFFTLGFLPIFVTLCRALQKYTRFSIVGLFIAVFYQIALWEFGLEDYIQHAPRTNLISANKEGIFSFWGYLSIFLFALDIGHYILPLDPYYTLRPNRQTKKPKPKKLVMILFSWSILFWLGFLIVTLCNIKVSRQMVNLSYVFWVASFNITYLSLFQSVELYYFKNYWKSYEKTVPNLAEAINSNGLLIFLVANLLTGFINLSIRTIYTSSLVAEIIIIGYMFIIISFSILLKKLGLRLKL